MENHKDAYEQHYKMWDWLSKNPKAEKEDYFIQETKVSLHDCFLCDIYFHDNCNGCPLKVVKQACNPMTSDNWYEQWKIARTFSMRTYYAELIRDVVLQKEGKNEQERLY